MSFWRSPSLLRLKDAAIGPAAESVRGLNDARKAHARAYTSAMTERDGNRRRLSAEPGPGFRGDPSVASPTTLTGAADLPAFARPIRHEPRLTTMMQLRFDVTQRDKTFGGQGLPERIQSLREAIDYFDESPLLRSKRSPGTERRGAPKGRSVTDLPARPSTTLLAAA
ncbi:hypothetical protein [Ensifer sp. SSB1]|uniref:hypothetical protein n=1 Tax=Ensifer sp. SSB1 TaxID=2795385 RepID=UPI0013AFF9F8|nr:hypothetical protein [Ensifer sp. SSB1]MBK5569943.1 hypothetical protein [Ensifer sp. SSB1]